MSPAARRAQSASTSALVRIGGLTLPPAALVEHVVVEARDGAASSRSACRARGRRSRPDGGPERLGARQVQQVDAARVAWRWSPPRGWPRARSAAAAPRATPWRLRIAVGLHPADEHAHQLRVLAVQREPQRRCARLRPVARRRRRPAPSSSSRCPKSYLSSDIVKRAESSDVPGEIETLVEHVVLERGHPGLAGEPRDLVDLPRGHRRQVVAVVDVHAVPAGRRRALRARSRGTARSGSGSDAPVRK